MIMADAYLILKSVSCLTSGPPPKVHNLNAAEPIVFFLAA